jgi:uncharacterized protein (TIGR02145 family)
MKTNRLDYSLIILGLFLLFLSDCRKQRTAYALPVVKINPVTDIGTTGFGLVIEVISDGGGDVKAGVCWSNNTMPTLLDNHLDMHTGIGRFSNGLNGLNPDTTYFVRAYATNSLGTAYSEQVTVRTLEIIPVIGTSAVSYFTSTTASSGGYVSYEGDGSVTTRGVCWSDSHDPTIANEKTSDGSGVGLFISSIIGLTPNKTYYLRAYLTYNSITLYGEEISFVLEQFTGPTVADIDGNVYHTVTIGTQVWMVENLKTTKYRNGDPVPYVAEASAWLNLNTGAYCNCNDDPNISEVYGKLYNWYAVNDSRKIAPTGWHVPNDAEWTRLTDYLMEHGYGYQGNRTWLAKSLAAKSGWSSDSWEGRVGNNQASNNSSGFTAFPAGHRLYWWEPPGIEGQWWSTSETDQKETARSRALYSDSFSIYDFLAIFFHIGVKNKGYSVRCVKD